MLHSIAPDTTNPLEYLHETYIARLIPHKEHLIAYSLDTNKAAYNSVQHKNSYGQLYIIIQRYTNNNYAWYHDPKAALAWRLAFGLAYQTSNGNL